jgi:ethanolamine ammonia-lyase small subunit
MKRLSDYTPARVGLGLAGASVPVKQLLEFRLAHARARDAVHFTLDTASLAQDLAQNAWDSCVLRTMAKTRDEYLKSPDKGRVLDAASVAELEGLLGDHRIVFVLVDGLSALAVHRHALPLLEAIRAGLNAADQPQIFIVQGGRVAVGDQIGGLLQAEISVVIIGERPGLSTPDSLGIYLTWNPRPGRSDAERNCISNIHSQGLSYEMAAQKLLFLIGEARRRKLSGVRLKETAGKVLEASMPAE